MNRVSVVEKIDHCPFMAGAADNLSTEGLCFMLKSLGYLYNVSIEKSVNALEIALNLFGKIRDCKTLIVY